MAKTSEESSDYEIFPRDEIVELKESLRKLRENPHKATQALQVSLDNLSHSMQRLHDLISDAMASMKEEEREEQTLSGKLDTVFDKLDQLGQQDEKIAEGIVALADMISAEKERRGAPKPRAPRLTPMPAGPPPGMVPHQMAPPGMAPPPSELPPISPPPPSPEKKGLFAKLTR